MNPQEIHPFLRKYTTGDGLEVVADLRKSHDSYLYDALSRRRLLDCYSMHAGQPLGWDNSRMRELLRDKRYVFYHKTANSDLYCQEYAEFVQAMKRVTKDFKYLFFIDGGCLAVENALKVAFDWKAQKLGLKPEDDPHFD